MNIHKASYLIAGGILILSTLACSRGANPAPTEILSPQEVSTASVPANDPSSASGACANPYLPIVNGATWNYKLTGPIPDTFTRSILSEVESGFTDQDIFGTGATRQGKWNCENGNLIALDPTNGNSASVNSNNVTTDFQTTESSGVTIPATFSAGDAWTQTTTIEGTRVISEIQVPVKNEFSNNCKAVGIESVTVEAGTFNAMRFDCQTIMNISISMSGNPIQTTMTLNSMNWYAENIGLVKTVATGEGLDSIIELVSYNIP